MAATVTFFPWVFLFRKSVSHHPAVCSILVNHSNNNKDPFDFKLHFTANKMLLLLFPSSRHSLNSLSRIPLLLPTDTIQQCKDVFGVTPKALQLEVVNHIGSGRDCILIAGCGWGKTLVYFFPLVLWRDRVIVVISPLRVLIEEQQKKLTVANINSISFIDPTTTTTQDTLDEMAGEKYRAVFLTPEMIIHSPRLKLFWSMPAWKQRLQAVVLDEAHCVVSWGEKFREAYDCIGDLRARVPRRVAFIGVSATLPPNVLETLKKKAHFHQDTTVINVGNDRPNIRLEVRPITLSNKFRHLDFLVDFKKTIVYFETRKETVDAANYLESLVTSSAEKGKIASYHAATSDMCKKQTMEAFRQSEVVVLLATEAAGMGCDINDIERVIQFRTPKDITCLVQRLGRAARDPTAIGLSILFAENHQPGYTFPDQDLAQYINTLECRRKVLNGVYGNKYQPNGNCCDLCHPAPQLPLPPKFKEMQFGRISKRQLPRRTGEHKALAKAAILAWRAATHDRDMAPLSDFSTEHCIMRDGIVETLSENFASIMDPEAINSVVKWRPWKAHHSAEVAGILIKLNKRIDGVLVSKPSCFVRAANASSQGTTVRSSTNVPGKVRFRNTTAVDMKKAYK